MILLEDTFENYFFAYRTPDLTTTDYFSRYLEGHVYVNKSTIISHYTVSNRTQAVTTKILQKVMENAASCGISFSCT